MTARRSTRTFGTSKERNSMKSWHMMLCAVFVVVGIVLVTAGAGAFAFLPALGCMLMMGMMIWMMVRPGGHGGH